MWMRAQISDGGRHCDECQDTAVGVCNACESLLVHEKVKERYLLEKRMTEEEGEEIRSHQGSPAAARCPGRGMSGSGPTVFGLFDDRQKAVRAKEALEGRYRQTYLAAPVKYWKDGIIGIRP